MKRIFTLTICMVFLMQINSFAQRYVEEVFDNVTLQTDIIYGANTTVLPVLLGSVPTLRPLNMNLLTPEGDTETNRPIILLYHTGNFLPQYLNGQINGNITDPYVVALGEKLTRMGYVVAFPDYRKGWNPSPLASQEEKTNTLINAAYRGVQDATTLARFLRKTVAEFGNPYGIDAEKIVIWGVGTGGYISTAAATIDDYFDVVLPKFIGSDVNGDGNPDPMVIPFINGDPFATEVGVNPITGDTLCYPNHVEGGYSSEFQLVVNMGGAIGDTSWIDENDPPMISFHVPTDPFAPYVEDILIVPTTGDLVVEVQGSYLIQQKLKDLGNNAAFSGGIFSDPFTDAANSRNDGAEGLFPMPRPTWDLTDDGEDNPVPVEASPWAFWDAVAYSTAPLGQVTLDGVGGPCEGIPMEFCNWDLISRGSNPDMTVEKGTTYQDTAVQYFAPRACLALALPECDYLFTNTTDVIADDSFLTITPNPIDNRINLRAGEHIIQSVSVLGLDGQLIQRYTNINQNHFSASRDNIPTGMYLIKTEFENGIATKKVVFK